MTRDEVLRLAREAGLCTWVVVPASEAERLERFAALVAAAVQSRKQHIDALDGDRLTADKADHICERDGYQVTGVVLTLADGRACIVNRSAVRWLSGKDDLFNLLHTDSALNHRQVAEAVAAEREACAKVCEILVSGDADDDHDPWSECAESCAAHIRARGSA